MRETRHLRRKKNRTPKRKIRTPKRKTRTPKRKTRTFKRKIRAKGSSGLDELKWDVVEPNKYSREEIEAAWILKNLSNEELNLSDSERSDYGKAMQKDPFKIINLINSEEYNEFSSNNKKRSLLDLVNTIIEID